MKKLKEFVQQLKSFIEPDEPEQPIVSANQVPPLPEPVTVGETVEAMIREEYFQRQMEETDRDGINEEVQSEEISVSPEIADIHLIPSELETDKLVEPLEEPEIIVIQEPEKEPSLSENRAFVKLAEECSDLMNEFDGYAERLETDEGKMMAEMVVKRMQELLERAGLERIDDETEFSVLRHTPIPMQIVQEGTTIIQTRFPGLAMGNRVYRKSSVIVDLSDKKQNPDQHEMP